MKQGYRSAVAVGILLLLQSSAHSAPTFSETRVTVVDQHASPISGALVRASYGCKTFNPVDSAGWKTEVSFVENSDAAGAVRFKKHPGSIFPSLSTCEKIIVVYRKGYASLESGHSFSSYSSPVSCLREMAGNAPDTSRQDFHSSCQVTRRFPVGEKSVEIKLYKLKTCDDLKRGVSLNQDRQQIARDVETLRQCLPGFTMEERQRFAPLFLALLAKLPKDSTQPLFEDEAIYKGSVQSLGYLCQDKKERVDTLKRWMFWAAEIEKSNTVGWGPILLAREAAQSLAMFDSLEAMAAVRKYLRIEEEYFYQRFPHLRGTEPTVSHHPWKIPPSLEDLRLSLCEPIAPIPAEFLDESNLPQKTSRKVSKNTSQDT